METKDLTSGGIFKEKQKQFGKKKYTNKWENKNEKGNLGNTSKKQPWNWTNASGSQQLS